MPPAGAPIALGDLRRWVGALPRWRDAPDQLASAMCSRFGVERCFLTSTGRAGLAVILRALRRMAPPGRDEVIVPAYTCYSVPASASRAGLRVRLVDVDPATLDFDRASLARADFRRVLAVVATNLYGLPGAVPETLEIARAHGAFMIDDAAQSMGASVSRRPSGTLGDVGLFSFDKGKGLSAIDGGAIVTNRDDLARALASEVAGLPSPSWSATPEYLVKLAAYAAFLNPAMYGIPNAIPALKLGVTRFPTDFAITTYHPWLAALASTMLSQLDRFVAIRSANAGLLEQKLSATQGVRVPRVVDGGLPSYVRFPVLLDNAAARELALLRLRDARIGATGSYPRSLADVPEAQTALAGSTEVPGARHVAERILTLPTHPFVTLGDIESMARALDGVGAAI